MRCPKCDHPAYQPFEPCPNCAFSGDPGLLEELGRVNWLLDEIDNWGNLGLSQADRQRLHQSYLARRRELEVALGLRLPPFTEAEAQAAWPDLFQREILLAEVATWIQTGYVDPAAAQTLLAQARRQIDELVEQLAGHARPTYPATDTDRLDLTDFLLEAVDYLRQNDCFTTPNAAAQILPPLLAQKEQLEIKLGLRPAAQPPIAPPPQPPIQPPSQPTAPPPLARRPPAPPAPPPTPLPERLWRTLLSERTLHAILFLGIFLLFSAALSFVVWGWQDFSPVLRVAIPTGFTAFFFGLGWLVRVKTPLYRSGLALSAIAALLIPIDFYTVYVNFNIPPDYWPLFWLLTSLVCLGAYLLIALLIQSRLFGYLVGVAAGSAVLAVIELAHQAAGLSLDWRTAALALLAAFLLLLATLIGRYWPASRWRALAGPFRYLALLTVAVLMPLTFGWRFIDRATYDTLHYALTITWWVGGLMFGWGAVYYRSRSLGLLAAISLPVAVYLTQAALFDRLGLNPAWHAFGWAWLVWLYFLAGYRLLKQQDPILHGHGRTAVGWGVVLLIASALWSLTDMTNGAAAAASHAVLTGAVILAALLWQQPNLFYAASLLSLSASAFAMTELELTLAQLSVGWALLAIGHIIAALSLGVRFPAPLPDYARPLAVSGYLIAGVALLPPLLPYNGDLLAYALGNWLGLTAWGAYLAHRRQPGFSGEFKLNFFGRRKIFNPTALFHWLTAIPLPFWLWLLFTNRRPPDFSLPLALAVLAWAMVALGYRLARLNRAYRQPWRLIGGLVSVAAPIAAFVIAPAGFTPALTLLVIGLLYLADALTGRYPAELFIAGLVIAWGYLLFLDRLRLSFEAANLALALLIAVYILTSLWTERRVHQVRRLEGSQVKGLQVKSSNIQPSNLQPATLQPATRLHALLQPLYLAAHLLTFYLLGRIYSQPFNHLFFDLPWTDEMLIWAAAAQLLLALVYGLYAWGTYLERWGHLAAWLGAAGGGFIALAYSTGRGSSAAKAALIAVAYVLAERALNRLWRQPAWPTRRRAFIRLAWRLFRRPLLVTGWSVSAIVIGLALVRNLWLLGGGRTQQIWAAAGLLLITGLYALSARLFRQVRFVWLAALLVIAPWTILTNLGWFTPYRPTTPGFALSWVLLAWTLWLTGLLVYWLASLNYAQPLIITAHLLLPLALLWGVADVDTSRFTFGLAIGLYALAAWRDHHHLKTSNFQSPNPPISILGTTKFFYPALGLIPVWCVYLLAWLLPAARHEHYGLMLLAFAPLGLITGRMLLRLAPIPTAGPAYARPAYLTGYAALIVGTMLVAHNAPLLALALLYDALLLVISAWLFKNPLWLYPAVAIVPIALLIAVTERGVPANRHGWWLLGLAAIYLALAWTLRRLRLPAYAAAPLIVAFALAALALPPSSQDQVGALWGYGAAALLYAIAAIWLGQPLLLTPACALAIVPYAIGLQRSSLPPEYYGLALLPGAVAALAAGYGLDRYFGAWRDFPWTNPARWPLALAERLAGWWALPFYTLGFGLAAISPFFTNFEAGLAALNFLLMMPLFGWAIARFRLRLWLLALALAGHLAALYYLDALGWWRYPAWAWLRFLPVTLVTAGAALLIEHYRREGSPLAPKRLLSGWSRPLYLLLLFDLLLAQVLSLGESWAGATITLTHALLLALLASVWAASPLAYLSQLLGVVALGQWQLIWERPVEQLPVALAQLALAYGLIGFGLSLLRRRFERAQRLRPWLAVWELPLQRFSLALSFAIVLLTAWLGLDLAGWTVRALLGLPFREVVELATVRMVVGVLSLLGLLYLAAAVVRRWLRWGYLAVGMLLTGWLLYAFYIQEWDRLAGVQWYAIPAGLYLLGIAYFEWQYGHKNLARWLDYAAMTLMLGSLFWQTLLYGWGYALLLGGEGFLAFWWGSARRLRRFFYAGMVGVILATLGQLLNALSSINQWIVFGIIGLLLVAIAVLVERKLEDIKMWQEKILETWE